MSISFDITCSACGHKFKEDLQRLQDSPSVVCPSCGIKVTVKLSDGHGFEMTTRFGEVQVRQGARGSVTILMEVYHKGLHKHRLIRGPDSEVVWSKAKLQAAEWNEVWAKRVATKHQMTMIESKKE